MACTYQISKLILDMAAFVCSGSDYDFFHHCPGRSWRPPSAF
jgi:hypothetical protein